MRYILSTQAVLLQTRMSQHAKLGRWHMPNTVGFTNESDEILGLCQTLHAGWPDHPRLHKNHLNVGLNNRYLVNSSCFGISNACMR